MPNAAMINEINDAIGAHGLWKMRLRTAIKTGNCDTPSHTACRDDQCAFGKWLAGPSINAGLKTGTPFQVIKRLHAEFHTTAGSVIAYVERGNPSAANTAMEGAYTEASEKLVRALMKWKGELAAAPKSVAA